MIFIIFIKLIPISPWRIWIILYNNGITDNIITSTIKLEKEHGKTKWKQKC